VYGTVASVVYGVIYWVTSLFYEKGPLVQRGLSAKLTGGL